MPLSGWPLPLPVEISLHLCTAGVEFKSFWFCVVHPNEAASASALALYPQLKWHDGRRLEGLFSARLPSSFTTSVT